MIDLFKIFIFFPFFFYVEQPREDAENERIANEKRAPSHGGTSRKRKVNTDSWKQNVRKKRRQSGKSYMNSKGNAVPAKAIKTKKDCKNSCKYKCGTIFSDEERERIFNSFYSMNHQEQKHFFNKTTHRETKQRCRTKKGHDSRRSFSFYYYFFIDGNRYRVCKQFYLTTIAVSARRISDFHQTKDEETSTPSEPKWGKHTKKKVSDERKQFARDHINSFPRIESHYCRAVSKKEYLEASLNLQKMYELYEKKCEENAIDPVKFHMYRDIFNHEFNIEFQKPKKDLCDLCYEFSHTDQPSKELADKHRIHLSSKNDTKNERKKDRELKDKTVAVVCIDLENVITLPQSNVGNFYYKRKLSQYNLTGHCSLNKRGYCVLWHEGNAGRGGNDIASGTILMLEKILKEFPGIKKFILWFDSCVPQNRNSYMSVALREFIINHPEIDLIEQKFCEPGHSSIQEVDNIHSQIDRALSPAEIFSPLGLLRMLPNVNRKHAFSVIQMQNNNIKNYSQVASTLNYKNVPYFSVKNLVYRKDQPHHVFYKEKFTEAFKLAKLLKIHQTRKNDKPPTVPSAKVLKAERTISKNKQSDLQSMYPYMPTIDVQFYKTILK